MELQSKVKINNPTVYSILRNAIENKKVSHAYLFSAPKNVNIIDEPLFLAQSIINDTVVNNHERKIQTYPDFITIDGSSGIIKKEAIINASVEMQQTALDAKGVKILLIKNIENGNKHSLNSLLKFLEEPTPNTYVIMTTNNLSKVISTIKSRAQIVNLRALSLEKFTNDIEAQGISSQYSRILASISKSVEEAVEIYKSKTFIDTYDSIIEVLFESISSPDKIVTNLSPILSKKDYKLVMSIVRTFFNDIWKYKQESKISFKGQELLIDKYATQSFDYQFALHVINDFIVAQEAHVNFELYKGQMLIKIRRCYG